MKDYKLIRPTVFRDMKMLCSERGHPLALSNAFESGQDPVLTVELYTKWYNLYLIKSEPTEFVPQGIGWLKVYSLDFGHLEDVCPSGWSPYCDHVPNPLVVNLFARRNGYEVDELAGNLIAGRWQEEVVDINRFECDRCGGTGEVPLEAALTGVSKKKAHTCRACMGHGSTKPQPRG